MTFNGKSTATIITSSSPFLSSTSLSSFLVSELPTSVDMYLLCCAMRWVWMLAHACELIKVHSVGRNGYCWLHAFLSSISTPTHSIHPLTNDDDLPTLTRFRMSWFFDWKCFRKSLPRSNLIVALHSPLEYSEWMGKLKERIHQPRKRE